MYRSLFPRDLFAEMDRLQHDTQQALEINAFAPGLDPDALELTLDRGVLTIAGNRRSLHADNERKISRLPT